MLATLRHDNIVQLIGHAASPVNAADESSELFLIMPLFPQGGALDKLLLVGVQPYAAFTGVPFTTRVRVGTAIISLGHHFYIRPLILSFSS